MLLWKLMRHAIQIRQTGGLEVLNWTPIAFVSNTVFPLPLRRATRITICTRVAGVPRRAFHEVGMSGHGNHTVI